MKTTTYVFNLESLPVTKPMPKKGIEFEHMLALSTTKAVPKTQPNLVVEKAEDEDLNPHEPQFFEKIILIARNYDNSSHDLMIAYNADGIDNGGGILFIGHWNDGVV